MASTLPGPQTEPISLDAIAAPVHARLSEKASAIGQGISNVPVRGRPAYPSWSALAAVRMSVKAPSESSILSRQPISTCSTECVIFR
jgi:hypothetical protein